jgi:hypothetical protein
MESYMPRRPEPWYRSDRDCWYVTIIGKRILLAKAKSERAEAYRRFLTLMGEQNTETAST